MGGTWHILTYPVIQYTWHPKHFLQIFQSQGLQLVWSESMVGWSPRCATFRTTFSWRSTAIGNSETPKKMTKQMPEENPKHEVCNKFARFRCPTRKKQIPVLGICSFDISKSEIFPRGSCVRLALSTGQNSLGCIRIKTLRIVRGTWNIYPKQPTFLLNFGRTTTLPVVVWTHPIQIAISNLDHRKVLIPQSLHWSEYINSFQSLLWKQLKRNTIQLSNRTFKEFSLESKAHLLQAAVARIEDAYLRSVRFVEALQLAPCSRPSNIYCQYQQKHHLVHPVRCPGTFAKCLRRNSINDTGHIGDPGSLSNNHGVDGFFTIQLGQQAMLAPLFWAQRSNVRRVKIHHSSLLLCQNAWWNTISHILYTSGFGVQTAMSVLKQRAVDAD